MFETKEEMRGMVVNISIPLPECQDDYDIIKQSGNLYLVVGELKLMFRNMRKYDQLPVLNGKTVETCAETIEAIYNMFYSLLEQNKVDLDI